MYQEDAQAIAHQDRGRIDIRFLLRASSTSVFTFLDTEVLHRHDFGNKAKEGHSFYLTILAEIDCGHTEKTN